MEAANAMSNKCARQWEGKKSSQGTASVMTHDNYTHTTYYTSCCDIVASHHVACTLLPCEA